MWKLHYMPPGMWLWAVIRFSALRKPEEETNVVLYVLDSVT